jgi:D-alanyl-D-alanine carboxypeptidase (penicillin-binding protein 5/6)
MNEKASEFGLKDSHFMNATGLPHEDHYSSMYDIAVIARRLIHVFPQFYHYFSEKTFTVNGIAQQNRNTLLGNSLNIDGLKTGKTDAGGYGIVISGKKDNKRLIVVVNGCQSSKSRSIEANKLLAIGFNEYMPIKIANKDIPVGSINILYGKTNNVELYTNEDINISIPKKYKDALEVKYEAKKDLEAPIAVGDQIGTLVYKYGNYVSKKYMLYARKAVERNNIFMVLLYNIQSFVLKMMEKTPQKEVEKPIGISDPKKDEKR